MNKKENEQLKKIDKLDQQLDQTISKIGVSKVKPIKISKKKLALFMLIPFLIACVISAVTSFLVIDPFHWYIKSVSPLLQQQEKEIKRIEQQFADLNLASILDNSNTIFDLLWELKNHPNIIDIVKEFNEIKSITSLKDNKTKLSSEGEEVNLKILVKTGSLEKEIDVKLNVIIENPKVKLVNKLVESKVFQNKIIDEIKVDGQKRASDLVAVIKDIISKNNDYKAVFNDIKYDIVNDKDDNEIIANGFKTLNVNFSFTENSKLISSSVKLNFSLNGKSRKEINQYLANNLPKELLNLGTFSPSYSFFAQTVFANESTYKDLIDELVSFAPKNNFYLWSDALKPLDSSNSRISIDFTIKGKTDKELNEKIIISESRWWETVELKLQFFIGIGQDKAGSKLDRFTINIMKDTYVHKEFFLYISKLREVISQGLFRYETKTKIGSKYGELAKELVEEVDRLKLSIIKPKDIPDVDIVLSYYIVSQREYEIISKENLSYCIYYETRIYFQFDRLKILDSPQYPPAFYIFASVTVME